MTECWKFRFSRDIYEYALGLVCVNGVIVGEW